MGDIWLHKAANSNSGKIMAVILVTVHEMFLHKTMQIPWDSLNLKCTELKIYSLSSNFEIQIFFSLDTMLKPAFQAQFSRRQKLQGIKMPFQKIKVESCFNCNYSN